MNVPVITSKTDALKEYITRNRGTCKHCELPVFWCSTARGKRVPVDFPDQIVNPKDKYPTVELVVGWSKGVWDGTLEVWPAERGTHTIHFDTCKRRAA